MTVLMRVNALRRVARASQSFRLYSTSISEKEMTHFNALASSWWDVNGPQRILHKMNLLRMDFIYNTVRNGLKLNSESTLPEDEVYIPPYNVDLLPNGIKYRIIEDQELRRDQILQDNKLSVLDVGCGGGILSESLARLSFIDKVTGIDLSKDVIEAANIHKLKDPMLANDKLEYKLISLDAMDRSVKYNMITMFEMLEHVDYPAKVLIEGLNRLEVGGWLFVSTINRDFISWFTTILMAEHVLRIVPVGTHTLNKYINQQEIKDWIEQDQTRSQSYKVVDSKGCVYLPAYGWKFTNSPNVGNFFMAIKKVA